MASGRSGVISAEQKQAEYVPPRHYYSRGEVRVMKWEFVLD